MTDITLKRMFEYTKLDADTAEITKFNPPEGFDWSVKIVVPESMWGYTVVSIAKEFMHKSRVQHLELPNSIKTLGVMAFAECSELKTVNIPESIEVIESGCFSDCVNLSLKLSLPRTLTKVESFAFNNCKGLYGDAIFGDNVLKIGVRAFTGTGLNGFLYYNPDSIESEVVGALTTLKDFNPFAGLEMTRLRKVADYTDEETLGLLISQFIDMRVKQHII